MWCVLQPPAERRISHSTRCCSRSPGSGELRAAFPRDRQYAAGAVQVGVQAPSRLRNSILEEYGSYGQELHLPDVR